ncbi:MAG: shikimate dehydrogenase, partial [Bdellovibrionales bacterium]|nr:shikimate dehydrogenase [Bdellovibrionales bacterium]
SSAPRVHAVIGDPISHSISPYIHNACYSRLQSDVLRDLFVSQRVKKDEIEDFLTTWRSSSALHGLAITIPLKEVALEYLDSLSADTIRIGAVNTVVKQGGELHGENTDWIGIARPLQNRLDLRGLKCCVLGGGGTARAAIYALRQSGAAVVVVNRTASKAEKLAELFSVECRAMSDVPQLQDFDVVVQTTSVGLKEDVSLYPSEAFREGMVVMDVVYSPQKTRFLKNAEQVGARIVTGDEMFIAQAEAQFKLHSGYSAPEGLMQKALEECLCR